MPPIFQILQERGNVPCEEMYQVFNMGIGMVAIVARSDVSAVARELHAKPIVPHRAWRRGPAIAFWSAIVVLDRKAGLD